MAVELIARTCAVPPVSPMPPELIVEALLKSTVALVAAITCPVWPARLPVSVSVAAAGAVAVRLPEPLSPPLIVKDCAVVVV